MAAGEILGHRLLSQHNLTHVGRLMAETREAITHGRLAEYRSAVAQQLTGYTSPP
jgi:tRNA-guanine family transglycosylase